MTVKLSYPAYQKKIKFTAPLPNPHKTMSAIEMSLNFK